MSNSVLIVGQPLLCRRSDGTVREVAIERITDMYVFVSYSRLNRWALEENGRFRQPGSGQTWFTEPAYANQGGMS